MAKKVPTQRIPANEINRSDRVVARDGRLRQVLVVTPFTHVSGKIDIVVVYKGHSSDTFRADEAVTIRQRVTS